MPSQLVALQLALLVSLRPLPPLSPLIVPCAYAEPSPVSPHVGATSLGWPASFRAPPQLEKSASDLCVQAPCVKIHGHG